MFGDKWITLGSSCNGWLGSPAAIPPTYVHFCPKNRTSICVMQNSFWTSFSDELFSCIETALRNGVKYSFSIQLSTRSTETRIDFGAIPVGMVIPLKLNRISNLSTPAPVIGKPGILVVIGIGLSL